MKNDNRPQFSLVAVSVSVISPEISGIMEPHSGMRSSAKISIDMHDVASSSVKQVRGNPDVQ
jgi:hypothetical protein